MAGGCDKAQTKAFKIVECVVQRMDFQFATIARTGIDLAYR